MEMQLQKYREDLASVKMSLKQTLSRAESAEKMQVVAESEVEKTREKFSELEVETNEEIMNLRTKISFLEGELVTSHEEQEELKRKLVAETMALELMRETQSESQYESES